MKRNGLPAGLVLALLGAVTAVSTAAEAPLVQRDLLYTVAGGERLTLDLFRPATPGPHPVVVAVHGGAWTSGDKTQLEEVCQGFTARGYAVACIDYRLAPRHPFPAALHDVHAAVRFLRQSSPDLGLDPSRIALLGTSAGGHLAALAALREDGPETRVGAVIDLYGPADLTDPSIAHNPVMVSLFGGPEGLREASPLRWVRAGAPPFLIVHGEKDVVVAPAQSLALATALRAQGDEATVLLVRRAGHDLVAEGGVPDPSHSQIVEVIADFLDRTLAPPSSRNRQGVAP